MLFGLNLDPHADGLERTLAMAHLADEAGFHLVGCQDHPYQRRFLDTWTLLAVVAARTRRVRLFPDVANLPLRPPAMLAKQAASLDVISGGRVELGLGAGGFWEAVEAMGGPRRSPGEALAALEEAIEVIRLMWSGEPSVRYQGQYYRLAGVKPGPSPAHDVEIWVGGYGPRMLELIGRRADGWVPSFGRLAGEGFSGRLRTLVDKHRRMREAAAAAGRDPARLQTVVNVGGMVDGAGSEAFTGSPARWRDELGRLEEAGADGVVFWPTDDHLRQAERFAEALVAG